MSKISSLGPLAQGEVSDDLDYISWLLMGKNLDRIMAKKRLIVEVSTVEGEPDFRSIEAVTANLGNIFLWTMGIISVFVSVLPC